MNSTPKDKGYSIGQFAELAGVTVRTLHHYDRIGLLSPSDRTEGQHRIYHRTDLLRLQQISTLKYLGFSLQEIEHLLASPAYDLRRSLEIQKDAINTRIRQMQSVSMALTRTLETLEATEAPDWDEVITVIQGLSDMDHQEWLQRYYSPRQMGFLLERAAHTPQEVIEAGTKAWKDLYADFADVQHLPVEHPDVQALAARMDALGHSFTNGDPEIERAIAEMFKNRDQMPDVMQSFNTDPALQTFMQQALIHYRTENEG